jgi:hypothetical protein
MFDDQKKEGDNNFRDSYNQNQMEKKINKLSHGGEGVGGRRQQQVPPPMRGRIKRHIFFVIVHEVMIVYQKICARVHDSTK